MTEKTDKTLYLCYFGLREPLVQTQVLPYLREIAKGGVRASILTFEPDPRANWTPEAIAAEREKLAAEGIEWEFLTYHKRPSAPATVFDVLNGARHVAAKLRRAPVDVLHARSHVPAMMAVLAKRLAPRGRRPKVLFDIRGFFPEEYTDAGIWPENGRLYRAVKRAEKWLLARADGFVVLTEKAREILFPESAASGRDRLNRPVEVIPCCVDLARFAGAGAEMRRATRERLKLGDRFVAVYVGSFGGFYMTDETADFYGALKRARPDAFALILSQSRPEMIRPQLEKYGYTDDDVFMRKVAPAEIPQYLSAADVALSFIKPSYSKLASSPTKNAEYLACGLPLVANSKVGDTAEFTRADATGVIIDDFSEASYQRALAELERLLAERDATAERCRASAAARFDLERVGGERYRRLYRRLLGRE